MGGYEKERHEEKQGGQQVVQSVRRCVKWVCKSGYACRRECVHAKEILKCRYVSKKICF